MTICLNCDEELIRSIDDDPNGEMNAVCARCRAEEEHDFDREPDAVFDRYGNQIEESAVTTPSPAALRAALAIKAKYGGVAIGIADDAQIIDDATGLPLLIEACNEILAWAGDTRIEGPLPLDKLRAAISATEKRTP